MLLFSGVVKDIDTQQNIITKYSLHKFNNPIEKISLEQTFLNLLSQEVYV